MSLATFFLPKSYQIFSPPFSSGGYPSGLPSSSYGAPSAGGSTGGQGYASNGGYQY